MSPGEGSRMNLTATNHRCSGPHARVSQIIGDVDEESITLCSDCLGLNPADGREVYLVPGDDGTWEGRLFTLLASKDGAKKCQHRFRILDHPYLHSWKTIWGDTAVSNGEVGRNEVVASKSICCERYNLGVSSEPRP